MHSKLKELTTILSHEKGISMTNVANSERSDNFFNFFNFKNVRLAKLK